MEDSLMRVFAADTVKSMMGRLGIPENQPIENGMITRSLESAQKKIEGFNFDARKHVLAYDDVLNRQRLAVYEIRKKLLYGAVEEVEELLAEVYDRAPDIEEAVTQRRAEIGESEWLSAVRKLILQVTDMLWVEHLELMDYTRGSVNLRAYGQRDPLMEYRKEGARLFGEMNEAIYNRIAEILPHLKTEAVEKEEAELRKVQQKATLIGGSEVVEKSPQAGVASPLHTFGRNDIVTITNGTETQKIKYKKAEDLLESGAWRLVDK
jgi:preprotein translocase subunit SecA